MNELPPKVRAFVALRMSREVEGALAAFIGTLRPQGGGIRWVRPGNLHLTLRFLGGAVETRMLAPLSVALAAIAAATAPFALSVAGTGAFPDQQRPRVGWAGLAAAELAPLAVRVEAAAVRCGFAPARRSYSPHLTIGRVRDLRGWPAARRTLSEAMKRDFGTCLIDMMILYRSILEAQAARYEELARYEFAPRG
ncbi:MAG: RNA 2',3'-cyclic phosphodiesterase [Candidatus Binataceae bacterium]